MRPVEQNLIYSLYTKTALIAIIFFVCYNTVMGEFDKILKNCKVLNVRTGEIIAADIAVKDGLIAAVAPDLGEGEDMNGMFALPGFIDAHVHIESSQLTPARFAEAVMPCGTTLVVADPHEIANVCGMDGVDFMIKNASATPLEVKMMMPSCVPASPAESSGAVLDAAAVKAAMAREDIFGLGEMMNYPGVIGGDEDVLAKLKAARDAGKPIDGHFPMGRGLELATYAQEGISSDHECNNAAEAQDKLAAGMDVFIRQGSAGKQLLDILPAVNSGNISRFSLCTDDCHAADILAYGHINHVVEQAVEAGISAADAVRMATLNPAEHYKLNCGEIAAGRQADIIIVPDLKKFKPVQVFKRGVLVAAGGEALFKVEKADISKVKNTLHMPPVTKEKLKYKGAALNVALKIKTGTLVKEAVKFKENLPKLCVAERHKNTGRVGVCAISGYPVKGGAVAISISHDSHNVVCAGDNDKDMCLAINSLMPVGGGVCVVSGGKVAHLLPLPIAGLMTDSPASRVASALTDIESFCKKTLNLDSVTDPVMTLSFLALTVIPHICLTDKGLFDCDKFCFV